MGAASTAVVLLALTVALAGCGLSASGAPSQQPPSDTTANAQQNYIQAQTLASNNHCNRAIPLYLRALVLNTIYVSAYVGLGNCYEALGSFGEAIAEYDKAIAIDPTNYGLYVTRAGAEYANGSSGAAIGDLSIALRFAPAQAPTYISIANLFDSYADFADSIKTFSMAIAQIPAAPSLYEDRANVYLQNGDTARAFADYQHAIAVAPTAAARAGVYADLAQNDETLGLFDAAAQSIAAAIHLVPNTARFYVTYGNIHRDAGGYTLALRQYDIALRLSAGKGPDAEAAHEGKGDVYTRLFRAQAAVNEYKLALGQTAKADTATRARLQGKIKAAQSGQS